MRLRVKPQEFFVNALSAQDLPFFAEHVDGIVGEQSIDGQPVLEILVIRKDLFKDKILPLINQKPFTRIELVFSPWK